MSNLTIRVLLSTTYQLWVADDANIYLGSANMDWKSLSQVKELGVIVLNSPTIAGDAHNIFESWWGFASLASAEGYSIKPSLNDYVVNYFNPDYQSMMYTPCWSLSLPESDRCPNPIINILYDTNKRAPHVGEGVYYIAMPPSCLASPFSLYLNGTLTSVSITAAPSELTPQIYPRSDSPLVPVDHLDMTHYKSHVWMSQAFFMDPVPYNDASMLGYRTNDIDGLIYTILEARKFVYLSVMDFLPLSQYTPTHFYWSKLFDALVNAVTNNVEVHMLISKWAHTSPYVLPFLQSIKDAGNACSVSDPANKFCKGSMTVRLFEVPGWDSTGDSLKGNQFPSFTRVNHAKYIVTEKRA